MSDLGDRTHPPTDRRRREARARGEVARSADLVAAFLLLATMAALWWLGPGVAQHLAGTVRGALSTTFSLPLTPESVARTLTVLVKSLAVAVGPLLLIAAIAAALGSLIQTGFLWTPSVVLPKFDRLDPTQGLGRWMSLKTGVALAAGLIKLVALLSVLVAFVRVRLPALGAFAQAEPSEMLSLAARCLGELGLLLALTLFALALLDYGFQFWRHEQSLLMTAEELKREQKEDELDPRFKRRRQELAATAASRVNTP